MLILVRKPQQGIVFYTSDGAVRVIVGGVERDRVKLLIHAPASVKILREEIE